MRLKNRMLTSVAILAGFTGSAMQNAGQDWLQWRGPDRDGTVASFAQPQTWPDQLTQQWKIEVGPGYATPLLVGDRVYMFSRKGENEVMQALEAATGKVLWETGYPAPVHIAGGAARHGPGPKSTPVFSNGKLYSVGMTGTITAFDAASGKVLWRKPGTGIVPRFYTHSFSPLVEDGLVFFHLGGHDQGDLSAYDVNTGDVKWSWDGDGPAYGSPVLVHLEGTRQIVTITQGKLIGLEPATGVLLWEHPYPSENFTNSMTPLIYGQTFIVSGREMPVSAIRVEKRNREWFSEKVWENSDVTMRMSNGVIFQDMLFSLSTRNRGQYFSLNPKTGETLWLSEGRQAENAAVMRAGHLVLSMEDDGELVVFGRNQEALEPLHRFKLADTETWTQPVFSGNRVFVKDVSTLSLWTWN